jgi:hypothetical protein
MLVFLHYELKEKALELYCPSFMLELEEVTMFYVKTILSSLLIDF